MDLKEIWMAINEKSFRDRRKYSLISLCVVWLFLGSGSGSLAEPSPLRELDVTAFLNRLAARISSYAPMDRSLVYILSYAGIEGIIKTETALHRVFEKINIRQKQKKP